MSIETFLPIQATLQGAAVIAMVVAVGYLAAAIVGWRGPNRKRRLLRFVLFLAVIPVCIGIHVALLHGVVLPPLVRNAENERQTRVDDVSFVQYGDAAPSFRVTNVNGGQFNLDDLHGKVALVNFFATWCGSCQKELPHLQAIWEEHHGNSDFAMIVIGREETAEAVAEFQSEHGYSFPMASDPERSAYSLYAKDFIPRTYLVSRDGTICFASTGFFEEDVKILKHELAKQLQSSR